MMVAYSGERNMRGNCAWLFTFPTTISFSGQILESKATTLKRSLGRK